MTTTTPGEPLTMASTPPHPTTGSPHPPRLTTRALPVLTILGLALAASSCTDDTSQTAPTPASPPPVTTTPETPSPEPSPVPSIDPAEAAAIDAASQAVQDYEALTNELGRNPTPDALALNKQLWAVADIEIAAREADIVLRSSEQGFRGTGQREVLNITSLEISLDQDPPFVRLSYCVDARSVDVLDSEGKSVRLADAPDLVPATATVSNLPPGDFPEFPSGWVVTESSNALYAQLDSWDPPEEDPCDFV